MLSKEEKEKVDEIVAIIMDVIKYNGWNMVNPTSRYGNYNMGYREIYEAVSKEMEKRK